MVFFAVSGLDLLGELDTLADQREKLVEWIYAQQVLDTIVPGVGPVGGFRGGPSLGTRYTLGGSVRPPSRRSELGLGPSRLTAGRTLPLVWACRAG